MDNGAFFGIRELWARRFTVCLVFLWGTVLSRVEGSAAGLEYAALFAFLSMLLGMGGLFWRFLFAVTGARWTDFWTLWLRRISRVALVCGGALTLFLLVADFGRLYPWSLPDGGGGSWYLNQTGITVRLGVCWVLLLFLAWGPDFLMKRRGDSRSEESRKYFRALSAMGLPLLFVVAAVWSVDGVMARDSHWHSALWPVQMILLFALLALCFFPMEEGDDRRCMNYGRCLLAFVLLHGYLMYSEGMLVWFGRIPEEIAYFSDRRGADWLLWGAALLSCFLPLVCLLFRKAKRNCCFLRAVAAIVLAGLLLELFWRFQPGFRSASLMTGENGWLGALGAGVLFTAGALPFLLLGNDRKDAGEVSGFHDKMGKNE